MLNYYKIFVCNPTLLDGIAMTQTESNSCSEDVRNHKKKISLNF
jgi:hypothetical protein